MPVGARWLAGRGAGSTPRDVRERSMTRSPLDDESGLQSARAEPAALGASVGTPTGPVVPTGRADRLPRHHPPHPSMVLVCAAVPVLSARVRGWPVGRVVVWGCRWSWLG